MQNAKPVTTPLAAHFRLSSALCPQSDEEVDYMSRVPHSSVMGSLMYAMVCSRLDGLCSKCNQQVYGKTWQGTLESSSVDHVILKWIQ